MSSATTLSVTRSPTRLVNVDQLKAEIQAELAISTMTEGLLDVELVESGHQHKGLCPLHSEDTPSFYVNDAKNAYHCFGCKEGGDAIDLLRKVKHYGFHEALRVLAAEADVDISKYERPLTEEEQALEQLRGDCETWLESLVSRPARGTVLAHDAMGVRTSTTRPPQLRDVPDYLFDGVIFPYRTPGGKLVGWKCRQLPLEAKKMFAVPKDAPIYEPTLFGIQEARHHLRNPITKRDEINVVEGEFDQEAVWYYGTKNVVATGGSAFTDDHLKILLDLKVTKVVFVFDGDEGGVTGAESVCKRYWNHPEIEVWIRTLPEGSDPEDLVDSGLGIEFVQPVHALEWLLRREFEKRMDSLGDKLEFVEYVRAEYGAKLDAARMDLVLTEVAKWLEIPVLDVLDLARAEKQPLHNVESEKIVLGRCVREAGYLMEIRKNLNITDFYKLSHQKVWQTLEHMLMEGLTFDLPTIQQLAEQGGVPASYVTDLAGSGDANITWHEKQIVDLAIRRTAQNEADRFREVISDTSADALGLISDATSRMANKALKRANGFTAIQDQVDSAVETMHERMRNPTAIHGLDLGAQLPKLSQKLQGLQPRRLVLLAAGSGAGKSTLSLQVCTNLSVYQSIPTDFISLEMDESEILYKMAAHLTGIDGMKITGGDLQENEAKLVEQAMARIRKSPLRLYAPDGLTTNEFILYAREARMQRRTEVFVLDYVQLISPEPGSTRVDAYTLYGDFGRESKMRVARAMDVTVFAVAQLNRSAADLERPTKENMGDSYDLVRHADVILIMKGEDESDTVDLWIDKNRQGPGSILLPLIFDRPGQTFREAHGGSKQPAYRVLP